MEKLLKWIGITIFLGWTLAILVNYSIYQHATTQITFLNPMADGILFMALMLGVYIFIWQTFKRRQSAATIQLAVLGAVSLVMAVLLA